jgi:cytochrome oxidase Cu insertion factor (SCO1/SenC/PrrC family)
LFLKFVLVFFGFTHCRVVCPRGLARISAALDALGEIPVRVAALYITVDPDRDNPQVMRNYLRAYPSILGLTGSREQIDDAKRNFRVFARRAPGHPMTAATTCHTPRSPIFWIPKVDSLRISTTRSR